MESPELNQPVWNDPRGVWSRILQLRLSYNSRTLAARRIESSALLPLYVFCGQQLLCAYLRPSRIDGAKHAAAILRLLVRRLRQQWPQVRIVFRADSGFCRQPILNFCERTDVHYIVGLARNPVLEQITQFAELALKDEYESTGHKQREVHEFLYATKDTWKRQRRVITRLECGDQGNNPRYAVTNMAGVTFKGGPDVVQLGQGPSNWQAHRGGQQGRECQADGNQPTAG